MPLKDAFIAELKHESSMTRKMLEKFPADHKDWKPHEKSMLIGRLASHVAETPQWISEILRSDVFDFATDSKNFKQGIPASNEELMELFQSTLTKALADLKKATDEDFAKTWTVKRGGQVMFSTPKKVAIRNWALNHLIHHRGQLSVYLRLLHIPVPGMYGPSADEKM